ncbi:MULTISPECIES: signal peptidase I [Halolamina]|uniref:Signal peptidase, endoplasmic reticulum-type n=1 Tax=Halolamina pelagica TaxID=699431 RepID=A0A1I5P2T3_9EURY|nr:MULTISPECIES: signal peptidase I [Halolamina]NHX36597.1 signal peptidase I [Halolamina sp. R1-12]SFP28277.1 signal peptidase, endoplasmic reticulum-type [Halolamina pelagica]
MSPRRLLTLGAEAAVVLVVASLLLGQVLGTPVLLGYVETGSMEPTLEPGDGFVAVPAAVAGDVEEGDVIVFRAEELQGGGLTTHRVVGETERGYITRGDANPFTDQDGDEPPVKEGQIVAEALQIGGSVVVIPNLGTLVTGLQSAFTTVQQRLAVLTGSRAFMGTQGLAYLLLGLSMLLYLYDLVAGGNRERERDRSRQQGVSPAVVVLVLAAVLVTAATAAMVVPAGTQQFGVVSAEFASENPTVIEQGGSATLPYTVPNAGLVPVVAYVEPGSEGVAIDPERVRVGGRSEATVEMTLTAPPETGYYRRFVIEHRYLALLPAPVIDALYDVHPWLPILVIDAGLAGVVALLGLVVLGGRRVRVRNRSSRHDRSTWRRLLRYLTR